MNLNFNYLNVAQRLIVGAIALGAISLMPAQESIKDLVTIDSTPLDRSLNGGVVSYAESLSRVRPAVVNISSKQVVELGSRQLRDPFWRFFGEGEPPAEREVEGQGSGVIVTKNGYILTNNHVVENAKEVTVSLEDGRVLEAKVIGTDPQTDVAVIKIESSEPIPYAQLADSEQIEVGDVVFAIGNPLGVGQTVTMGIVSAKGRDELNMIQNGFENFIQTDASINQGNSGGALVDARGRMIGINTLILTDGRSSGNIGIGFAIPTSLAYDVMVDLVENGSVARGFLGVVMQPLDEDLAEAWGLSDTKGALINAVGPGSPAEAAGLKQGDIIVKVANSDVESTKDLRLMIASRAPGSTVELTVFREDKFFKTEVILGEWGVDGLPSVAGGSVKELLEGIEAQSLNEELRRTYQIGNEVDSGIVITKVSPDSPYSRQFVEGMVIEKIQDEEVSSVKDAKELLEPGKKIALFVYSQGYYRYMAIEVEE